MKYNYEYKRMCVELYRQGKYPETPEGTQKRDFHKMIRKWVRMENSCGPEALRRKNQNKEWTAEERYELVAQVLAGKSIRETAFSAGISDGQLHQWVKRYCLHVCRNVAVTITAHADSEALVQSTENDREFATVFYRPEDCRDDIFGQNVFDNKMKRTVRTVFDYRNVPCSNMVNVKVINHHGG